jgi:glutamyl-Q tRNA(Asp) synthetase
MKPGSELGYGSPREVLNWGIQHWDAALIPRTLTLPEAQIR